MWNINISAYKVLSSFGSFLLLVRVHCTASHKGQKYSTGFKEDYVKQQQKTLKIRMRDHKSHPTNRVSKEKWHSDIISPHITEENQGNVFF